MNMSALRTVALSAALALYSLLVPALGKPDWAKPYLDLPSPSGAYIAQADHWAIVYGEVEFALSGCCIEERHHYILENRTDHPLAFTTALSYNPSLQEITDAALNVERAYLWHDINLKKSAVEETVGGISKLLFVGAEDVPGRHRVVWEYVLVSRYPFQPWRWLTIPQHYPAAQVRFRLEPGAANAGLSLDVTFPADGPIPPSFERAQDGSWTVKEVPAFSRLDDELALQPYLPSLYPYVVVVATKDPASGWAGLSKKYREDWNDKKVHMDKAALSAKAASLTADLKTPYEKAAKVARFVQSSILYDDSNEQGLGAWFPLPPQDSLRSMKADCKGKVLLLDALLESVGIESAPVCLFCSPRYCSWGAEPARTFINHVVIAVHLPAELPQLPATLLDGPAKGWVLFDPTLESVTLGAALPGFEDTPALLVNASGDGRFTIHTQVPSVGRTEVALKAKLDPYGVLDCSLVAKENGSSPFVSRLQDLFDSEKLNREALQQLSRVIQQPSLKRLNVNKPPQDHPAETVLEMDYWSNRALEEMSTTALLTNPLAAAALLAGIPNGLAPKRAVPPEERVELAPPWTTRLNTRGMAFSLDVSLELALPPAYDWTPPAPRDEKKPWVVYSSIWTRVDDNSWKAVVHLDLPRGEWPPAQRKEALVLLDQIFMDFYQPLLLKKK